MVLGWIEADNFGAKVVGRAGSDLNGTLMFLLLAPLMCWFVYMMHVSGQGTPGAYITIGLLFGLGLPFTLWWNHKDRKNADPLVRFIRKSIEPTHTPSNRLSGTRSKSSEPNLAATMCIDGTDEVSPPSPASVASAINALAPDGFLIVEFGPQTYMQTARKFDRFLLERRDGNADLHFRAKGELSMDQVIDSFDAYLTGAPGPRTVQWEAMQ